MDSSDKQRDRVLKAAFDCPQILPNNRAACHLPSSVVKRLGTLDITPQSSLLFYSDLTQIRPSDFSVSSLLAETYQHILTLWLIIFLGLRDTNRRSVRAMRTPNTPLGPPAVKENEWMLLLTGNRSAATSVNENVDANA